MEKEIVDFIQWACSYHPLICFVKDKNTKNYGKFWILDSNENINGMVLSVEELYDFYKKNPDWVENVAKLRL